MNISGEERLGAAQDRVWAFFEDPAALARCLPGCEELKQEGPDTFHAVMKVGIAAIKGTYEGKVRIVERRPPDVMGLAIDAQGSGGWVKIEGQMEMLAAGAETLLKYNWEVAVGGPVAMVGQRMLGGAAKMIIGQFFQAARKELVQAG